MHLTAPKDWIVDFPDEVELAPILAQHTHSLPSTRKTTTRARTKPSPPLG
jgi:hypothetical protein